MNDERRILYICMAANFVVGVIVGILLFYGQLKSNADVFDGAYSYSASVELADFFRVWWLNVLWLFSIFIAHNILPVSVIHPIIFLRGCASSFSMMYILRFVGVGEAVVSVIPQCVSVLPLLGMFSVNVIMKRRDNLQSGREPFSMRSSDAIKLFMFAAAAGVVETLVFRLFSLCFL